MEYTADLKSAARKGLRVRVPPLAPKFGLIVNHHNLLPVLNEIIR